VVLAVVPIVLTGLEAIIGKDLIPYLPIGVKDVEE
jgi:hypothetical protein